MVVIIWKEKRKLDAQWEGECPAGRFIYTGLSEKMYDTILFSHSIYNQVSEMTNRKGHVIFAFQTL